MRLIDADKLMNKYKGHHDFYLNAWDGDFKSMDAKDKARCDELTNCIAEIVNAPTIEIIRCRECIHCVDDYIDVGMGTMPQFTCELGRCGESVQPNDFCSYGEREEEDIPMEYFENGGI